MMVKWYVALVLGLSFLVGCAVSHKSPRDPTALVPDRSSQITVGQMKRAAVRSVLGAPKLSSTYWAFDLFRADTEQTEVILAVTPWPIPFARIKDQMQRYTLVAYDTDDRVSAVATGLFRRPAAWRKVSPIEFDYPSLHLRAGEVMFFVDPERGRGINLLVSPQSRDAFLQYARSSRGCTAVLGCGDRGCADQLSVDAIPAFRLPVRTTHVYWVKKGEGGSWLQGVESRGSEARMPWLDALVALNLTSGEHTLEFSAEHINGRTSFRLACRPGEVTYLIISAFSKEGFWKATLVDWQIDRRGTMPECFAKRPLVLVDDGQWYVDAGPGEEDRSQ